MPARNGVTHARGWFAHTITVRRMGTDRYERSISATRKASSRDCWVFSLGSQAVS